MKKTFYIIMAIYLVLFAIVAKAQNVSTIAGTGGGGATGDGGAATAAQIGVPTSITTDAAGNIYFTDYSNNVVRKIDPSGTISLVAGSGSSVGDGGAATAAMVYSPHGIAVDASGNIYIADYGQARIRKVNTAGIITTIAGTGVPGLSGDGGAATAAKIDGPSGIVLDASNNIFFTDRSNNRVCRIDATSGVITTIAGSGPGGFTGDGGPAAFALLNNPIGIAIDAAGNLFVADYSNRRIRKISAGGTISTYAGNGTTGISVSGPATSVALNGGIGLYMDGSGNLYVAEDATGNKVRVINSAGIIDDFAGTGVAGFSGDGGAASSARFSNTKGVTFDAAGNAYIIDAGNYRIRKVQGPNHIPSFTGGHTQSLSVCENSGLHSINSLLSVNDIDPAQPKTWSTVTSPTSGVLVASYTTSTGGTSLTPTGLTYVPGASYSGPDMFKVRVTDGTESDTTTVNVTVNPQPTPAVTTSGSTLIVSGSYSSYQWYTGASTIAGETNASFTAANSGSYWVMVTDANGCTGASAPQNVIGLGINDISTTGISVYPNPVTNDVLNMLIPGIPGQQVHIVITNIIGEKVKEAYTTTSTQLTLDINVPAGVYIISAATTQGTVVKKIIVQ